jgi:hypothetical protein
VPSECGPLGNHVGTVLESRISIVGEDALELFLPFEQRCGQQIFAVEVKQVEQENTRPPVPVSLAF